MERIKASLYGMAVAEALGIPLKGKLREDLFKRPVREMGSVNGWNDEEGHFGDSTSLTLATISSFIEKEIKINHIDIMKKYCEWVENGNYSSNGKPAYNIGKTTFNALNNFHNHNIEPLECGSKTYEENDNESLGRMLPIALYCFYNKVKDDDIYDIVKKYSYLTHQHQISVMANLIYVRFVLFLLRGKDKYSAYNMIKYIDYETYFRKSTIREFSRILDSNIKELKIDEIQSTNNAIDTLEAVIWMILNTDNYSQAVIGAVNLGDDTDTIGAVVGGVAGILYGTKDIPYRWMTKLKGKDLLDDLSLNFEIKLKDIRQ